MQNPLNRQRILITPDDLPWSTYLREIWNYRELLYFLVWRDFIARFKQTRGGLSWAVLQPLMGLLVYWFAFGVIARVPSGDTPYPLFIFAGLIPFTFVSDYLCRAVDCLTGNKDLIGKVYFPRIYPALSALCIGLIDFFVMLLVMAIMMVAYGCPLRLTLLFLPFLILISTFIALGGGLFVAAANVRSRDASRLVGLFVRFLFFASPVFYSRAMVPSGFLEAYDLNPMSAIICGFRWTLLAAEKPPGLQTLAEALLVSCLVLLVGLEYFRRVDKNIADSI